MFRDIIDNSKKKLSLVKLYENSSAEFVLRQTNEIVYNLAQTTTLSASFQIFVEIPQCIEHILINEML